MKRVLMLLTVLLLLLAMATPAYATQLYLTTVVPRVQDKSNWCWAASAEMVQKHFWSSLSQWADVDYIYPNQGYPNYGGDVYQTDAAIDNFEEAGVNGMIRLEPLTFTAIQYQTIMNGPIVAFWSWFGFPTGHAVVIRGFDDASPHYVYYCEPEDGAGHKVTYSWFLDNGEHEWWQSIFYR